VYEAKMPVVETLASRGRYLRRIFEAYVLSRNSNLTFWHEKPAINPDLNVSELGPYYMTFEDKARYPGPFDDTGIPLLDYHGTVGKQYYAIAIAQYALANFNVFKKSGKQEYRDKFLKNADWLMENLVKTTHGTYLWPTFFDLEYFEKLRAPWFSGLAQGQGLSVLVRAFVETRLEAYLQAADKVYESLSAPISEGGVLFRDQSGAIWIEEYVLTRPTHILNGFIWALWGVYDYYLIHKDKSALTLFQAFTETILKNLDKYDTGFWSYYELTPQRLKSPASTFYHRLHIVQLQVMYKLTGEPLFLKYRTKWAEYEQNILCRYAALFYKIGFKLIYY